MNNVNYNINERCLTIVVLISGNGSNLQALIDAQKAGLLINIAAVISNEETAFGLERARRNNIPVEIINHRMYLTRALFDQQLQKRIDYYQPDLVLLAGFMRILTSEFVLHYRGRLLNIHPSLLPKFKGLHTHRRVLEANEKEHGASVHFVTSELDGGPVILQARVPVLPKDDESSLAARVLEQEHIIYPTVIRWFVENRICLNKDDQVQLI